MRVLAFLHGLPLPVEDKILDSTIGAPWRNNIMWVDFSRIEPVSVCHIVETFQPQVVIAFGDGVKETLRRVKQAVSVDFKLLTAEHPYNSHRSITSLKCLRTHLDMELNMREGSGADK